MADKTAIEWTDATWNPVRGCSRVSPGCGGPNHEGGCYAEKIAARFSDPGQPFHGFAERTAHGGRWTGKLALIEDQLTLPLRWKRPRRIFVNSMSDLFHENLPDEAIDKVFAVMALCPQHTFQVLTKRADRMRTYLCERSIYERVGKFMEEIGGPDRAGWYAPACDGKRAWLEACLPLPNVWLGVSAEDQQRADERIPDLLATPAAVRFISAEPLLGPINLKLIEREPKQCFFPWCGVDKDCIDCANRGYRRREVDWVIVGGESGPNARPMHPDWARSLRDQCRATGIPFFFKQWGEWVPQVGAVDGWNIDDDPEISRFPHRDWEGDHWGEPYTAMWCDELDDHTVSRVGKKAAGRLLDGREHSEFPA